MQTVLSDESGGLTPHQFSFKGDGGTYLLIYIRTMLLAIVTLGIYDAWGTVERRRYMAGNTVVAGHGFDYHARPMAILIGRFIAMGILIGLNVLTAFVPQAAIGVLVVFVAALPWIINRYLAFHLRNTSYRNIRFDFQGSYWHSFLVTIVLPLAIVLSAGLAYPWAQARYQEYVMNRVRWGRSGFGLQMTIWPLYKAYFMMLLSTLLFMLVMFGIGYLMIPDTLIAGREPPPEEMIKLFFRGYLWFLIFLMGWIAISFIFTAAFRNNAFKNLTLEGGHRFDSSVTVKDYAWVVVSRSFLATLTGGILIPWAEVQIHSYLMNNTVMLVNGDLDDVIAHENDGGGAAAAEYGAFEGVSDGVFGGIG